MDNNNTGSQSDPFEENLREILSNNAVPGAGKGAARAMPDPTVPDEKAIAKMKAEERALLVFKILRPIAAVALVVLLAMFVARITAVR